MSIRAEIAELFRQAIAREENTTPAGSVDWDFVEADIMIDFGVDRIIEEMGSLEAFYPYFNQLVDLHLASEAA